MAEYPAPPPQSPVEPIEPTPDSAFRFNCHKNIACCRNIDITLTPYDIVRLKRRMQLTSKEFVARYTVPFEMDGHGMPHNGSRTAPRGARATKIRVALFRL